MANTTIPGLEVNELETMRRAWSPEAQAWRAQQAAGMRSPPSAPGAAAGEAAAAQAARGGSAAYRVGHTLGNTARAVKQSIGGGGAAPLLVAGGTLGAMQDASAGDSTARYAKRFGVSEPTGDGSFGDMAKFAGLRAGGFASDLGANILDTGTAVVNGVRGAMGAQPIPTFRSLMFRDGDPNQAPTAPAGAAKPAAAPAAAATETAAAQPVATGAPATAPNIVQRNGNSFSGSNIREGFQYQDPGGALTTPVPRVTSVPTVAGLDPALSTALHEAKLAAISRGESLGPGGVTVLGSGSGYHGNMRDAGGRPAGPMTRSERNAMVAMRGQDLQHEATMAGQGVQARGQDMNYDLGLRGQDVQMRGQDMSNQVARANARMEQMNKDRQYNLDLAKFGEEKAKTMFDQRERSDKDLTAKLESMFTTRDDKGNFVVDRQRVATHKAGITAAIGERAAALEAIPQNSKDYAEAQKLAGQLREKGAAALSEDALQKLIAQLEVKERSAAGHSAWNPFASTHVDSSNPADYGIRGERKNLILPDEYVLENGGTVPKRYLDKANGDLIGGQKTTRFDILKQGMRQ